MSAVRTTSRLAMAFLAGILLLVVAAPTAMAQAGPYGSTTTTAPPSTDRDVIATCGLSVKEGRPGDTVVATVGGVFFGEKVRILFDGVQVATGTAPLPPRPSAALSPSTALPFPRRPSPRPSRSPSRCPTPRRATT